ncbi:MAG: AAA family ATPase [Solirubrobacteraceae bacterium]
MTTAPAWYRELQSALAIAPQIVLEGNVHDRYFLPNTDGKETPVAILIDAIWRALSARGYEALVIADPAQGSRCHPPTEQAREAASFVLGRPVTGDPTTSRRDATPLESLREDLLAVAFPPVRDATADEPTPRAPRVALVAELASRLTLDPERLSEAEHAVFVAAEQAALAARSTPAPTADGDPPRQLFNTIVFVVDRDRELPPWLMTHDDRLRTISIPRPSFGERRRAAASLLKNLPDWPSSPVEHQEEYTRRLASQTDGLTIRALASIAQLAREARTNLADIDDAARAYRVGVVDNPWRTEDLRERLRDAEATLGARVLGQDDAVRKALDLMLRASTGLTGAHGSPYGTRPRGALFLAGPTGVGKTELAKALTTLVFGDEDAYIRFDMSEFSAEQAAERLIGAPPGYVGFSAGGELTNAVRERPFSLVLFDEIDKANRNILDKFLQILEDGRLTDGRGATVYFTECVLVFTSNLGIWVEDPDAPGKRRANVTRTTPREEAHERIREAITDHFTRHLGRPELLNRLGDGIVVFDFIDEDTGRRILDLMLRNVVARVEREYGATLIVGPDALATLTDLAIANLDNGGRGIGTVLESALVNPLSRHLFAAPLARGDTLTVAAVHRHGQVFDLEVSS